MIVSSIERIGSTGSRERNRERMRGDLPLRVNTSRLERLAADGDEDAALRLLRDRVRTGRLPSVFSTPGADLTQSFSTLTKLLDRADPYIQVASARAWADALDAEWRVPKPRCSGRRAGTSPRRWVEELLAGADSPKFRVLRALDLTRRAGASNNFARLFAAENLAGVRDVSLVWTALPAQFLFDLIGGSSALSASLRRVTVAGARLDLPATPGPSARVSELEELTISHVHVAAGVLARLLGPGGRLLPRIRSLDLERSRIREADLDALARAESIGELEQLVLPRIERCSPAALRLVTTPRLRPLKRLDLEGVSALVTGALVDALAEARPLDELRSLRIGAGDLRGGRGAKLFRLAWVGGIRHLCLQGSRTDDSVVDALAQHPHLAGIRTLRLDPCGMTDRALASLLDRDELTGLEVLELSPGLACAEESAQVLATRRWTRRLRSLSWGGAAVSRATSSMLERSGRLAWSPQSAKRSHSPARVV